MDKYVVSRNAEPKIRSIACMARAGVAATLLFGLASCADGRLDEGASRDLFGDLLAPSSKTHAPESEDLVVNGDRQLANGSRSNSSYIVRGSNSGIGADVFDGELSGGDGETYSFRFVDAKIEDVIEAVLGQALKLNYAIDPSVSGNLSMSTSEPVDGEAVLEILADILSLNGVALVQVGDVYRVQPSGVAISDSMRRLGSIGGTTTEIVPLQFASGEELAGALEAMSGLNVIVRSVPRRNLITLTGSRQDVAQAMNFVDTFDTHALEGMSFGLFYLDYAGVSDVVGELRQIFGGESSGLKLIPIERLNGFFAFAPEVETIQEISKWRERLDRAVPSAAARIFVHAVRHRRSSEIADILNNLYQSGTRNVSAGAQALSGGVDTLPVAGRVVDDEANNSILFHGSAAEYEQIRETILRLDVLPYQVLIEAAVVEVSLDNELRYGVQWLFESGDFKAQLSNATTGAVTGLFPGFATTVEASNINAVLSALDAVTSIRVVSSPRMLVESGKTAALQVGDEVPIVTQTSTSSTAPDAPTVNTVQYRDTGVILKVTPQVNEGGFVKLHIVQEISDVTTTTTSDLDSPTIQQRRFESYVSVEDGSTIALGGLIRDRSESGRSGVPIASGIPILGNLFSTTSDAFERSELLVLLTPRVVQTSEDLKALTDELKAGIQASFSRDEKDGQSDRGRR